VQKEGEQIVAQSEAVIWNKTYRKLRRQLGLSIRALLQAGVAIRLKARVDYNERYGLKLVIEEIDPAHTLGQLELQKRATLQKLQEKGLIGKNKEQELPKVLQKIAIISSERAAGLQDFLNQITSNPYQYYYDLQIFPASMQGDLVVKEVLQQLKKIRKSSKQYDCVVIIRGGGAKLDLNAFDQYELSEAIANFTYPVLAGIGHETDESILDRVVHTSLKTPTAVAEFIINRTLHFESEVMQMAYFIQQRTQQTFQMELLRIHQLEKQFQLGTQQMMDSQKQQLHLAEKQIPQWVKFQMTSAKQQLQEWEKQLELLSVENTLARGYHLLLKDGKLIDSVKDVKEGDQIETQFKDGTVSSTVNDIKKKS
jgi:exodeoxyribonuclease VII large subunit